MVPIRNINEIQSPDFDRPRRKFHLLTVTGEIVGPLTLNLDCRIAWRDLLDKSRVRGQKSTYGFRRRSFLACGNGAPFSVVCVALLTPLYRETIKLAAVHHERNGFGGFTKRDR